MRPNRTLGSADKAVRAETAAPDVEPLFKIVPLEHPRHTQLGGDFDQLAGVDLAHPFAIEADLGSRRIEHFGDLILISRGISFDLLEAKVVYESRSGRLGRQSSQ